MGSHVASGEGGRLPLGDPSPPPEFFVTICPPPSPKRLIILVAGRPKNQ